MAPPVDVMILCAGLGTRLRPLTLECAKPAVPLLNRPLVGYALELAKKLGVDGATINTHWLPETMQEAARQEADRLGLELRVSHEPELLGTGGGLWQARERGLLRRDSDLLILNGDVLFEADLDHVWRVHRESKALATMVLRPMPVGASYSPIQVDVDERIHRIGKHGSPSEARGWLLTGVHVLSAEALDLLPTGASSVIESVYAPLLARGARIQAAFEDGLWLDLGDPPGYLEAHLHLIARGAEGVSAEARIASSASVVQSAVGAGAEIKDGARVVNSVVWPHSIVGEGEHIERMIITPHVRLPVPIR